MTDAAKMQQVLIEKGRQQSTKTDLLKQQSLYMRRKPTFSFLVFICAIEKAAGYSYFSKYL